MKKSIKYLYALVLAAAVMSAGCSHDFADAQTDSVVDGKVSISGSVEFPYMLQANTRSLGDAPAYNNLDLYLLVFDDTGLNETIVLKHGSDLTVSGSTVKYSASITETELPARIHIIAIEDSDNSFAESLDGLWGHEDQVMQDFVTSNGKDAYWQRIDLNGNISKDRKAEITSKMQGVKLIRNFARVSLEVANGAKSDFTLIGFNVVNVIKSGTIVPMLMKTDGSVDYVDFTVGENESGHDYYHRITGTGYTGRRALTPVVDSSDERVEANKPENIETQAWNSDKKYFYERPFLSTNHIYVIVKGKYLSYPDSYYKVDLGETDEDGVFTYYNLLRNIDYHIVILSVEATGYSTAAEAAAHPACNNICAAVETLNQSNVTDGNDFIEVNSPSFVFVNTDPVVLKYRYSKIESNEIQTSEVAIKYITGDDIATIPTQGEAGEDGWYSITINPSAPTDVLREQSFVLYKSGGLSRKITLISRRPWQFGNNVTITPTTVGAGVGAKFSINVELPAGLPRTMFPLRLTFESNNNNIKGRLGDTSFKKQTGPSLFDSTETADQIVKVVQWNSADQTEYSPASRVVICDFETTTAYEDSEGTTQIRISNPYFSTIKEVSFNRTE